MIFINNIIKHLESKNHKGFYLSVMRVLLGVFLLKEIALKIPYTNWLYSNTSIFQFNNHSSFIVLGIDVTVLKQYYQFIIAVYISAIIFFIFGIGKRYTAFAIFMLILVLQKINNSTVNGGDKMARLLLFYFVFANSFDYCCYKIKSNTSTINNVVSNLAAYSMMLQLCLAYFVAFINKINNPYWFNGSAIYYVFQTQAYQGTSINSSLAKSHLFVYVSTYFTLLFEGGFPFLIWFKKLRLPLVIAGLILHFGIYFFMMIYNLQIIFLLPYCLFFTNDELLSFCKNTLRLNFLQKAVS
jgi:hypothetical protein